MKELEWQGNSKKMYDTVLNEVPAVFSGAVKKSINNWIVKNDISVVTEDTVFRAVNEIAPPDLAKSRIKPALEKLRTSK